MARMKELTLNLPSDSGSADKLTEKDQRANDLNQRLSCLVPALVALKASLKYFWLNQEKLKTDLDAVEKQLKAEPLKQTVSLQKQQSPEKKQKKKRGKKAKHHEPERVSQSPTPAGPSFKDLGMLEVYYQSFV